MFKNIIYPENITLDQYYIDCRVIGTYSTHVGGHKPIIPQCLSTPIPRKGSTNGKRSTRGTARSK